MQSARLVAPPAQAASERRERIADADDEIRHGFRYGDRALEAVHVDVVLERLLGTVRMSARNG